MSWGIVIVCFFNYVGTTGAICLLSYNLSIFQPWLTLSSVNDQISRHNNSVIFWGWAAQDNQPDLNKEKSMLLQVFSHRVPSAAVVRGGSFIIPEVDNIDFHPNISAHWFICLFWMRAHKPIQKPPSPDITRASWLIAVSHACLLRKTQLKHTLMGPLSSSSRSRAAGRQRLLTDGLTELTPRNPLHTHVDLSPDVAWQRHIRPTLR